MASFRFLAYKDAIVYSLGGQFVDFAQVLKIYRSNPDNETRYSPSMCIGCQKVASFGRPDLDRVTAYALQFAHYNFCRPHTSLSNTPAMESGLTNHAWTIKELIS